MPAYPTSPSGIAAAKSKHESVIQAAKRGTPLQSSGTLNNVRNTASPSPSTISRNNINKSASAKPSGSTSDTGRMKP